MKNIRHGDVNLQPVEKIEGEIVKHIGKFVIAEGETTGHKHVITVENPNDMEIRKMSNGLYAFILKSEGIITHEEHKTLIIPPGTYKEVREKEMDWFSLSVRRVID
jgi:hypothetical protein